MESTSFVALLDTFPIELILWSVLGVTVIVFGIFSGILLWHWKLYSTGKFTTAANMIMYLSVSAGLLGVMILSILWYAFV